MRIGFALVVATAISLAGLQATLQPDRRVEIVATPNGGIQPQAVFDAAGTIHLLYFKGEPGGGNLYYVRRKARDAEFSAPLRVNTDAGTAIAAGSVRGASAGSARGVARSDTDGSARRSPTCQPANFAAGSVATLTCTSPFALLTS